MNALYIGRFQPFHAGHADAIDQIFSAMPKTGKLYIGIGSAENNFTMENPLTAGERMTLIESAMREKGIPAERFAIIPIRNIDHYALWPYHVQQYLPKIDMFFSGSPLVRQLWSRAFPDALVHVVQKNVSVSATQVRASLHDKKDVSSFCLPSVCSHLKEWKISERLADMRTA